MGNLAGDRQGWDSGGGGLGCLRAGEMGVSRPLNPPLLPSMLTNTQCLQNNNAKVKK